MNLVDNKGVSPLMLSVYYGCPQVGQSSNDESMTRMDKGIRVLKLLYRRRNSTSSVARLNNVGDGIDDSRRMVDVNNCLTDTARFWIQTYQARRSSNGSGRGSRSSNGNSRSGSSGGRNKIIS